MNELTLQKRLLELEYQVRNIKQGYLKYNPGETADETSEENSYSFDVKVNSETASETITANETITFQGAGNTTVTRSSGVITFSSVGSGGAGYPFNHIIVASAGGDYTTLGAAVASITAGASTRIFIKNGTYSETAQISLPSDTWVLGETMENTILKFESLSAVTDGLIQSVGISTAIKTNIMLSDFTFRASAGITYDSPMLNCVYMNNSIIQRIKFDDARTNIKFNYCNNNEIKNIELFERT